MDIEKTPPGRRPERPQHWPGLPRSYPACYSRECGTSRPGSPVSASAVPRLTAMAERTAKINGDARPTQVTVVMTTRQKALTSATPGDLIPGSGRCPGLPDHDAGPLRRE